MPQDTSSFLHTLYAGAPGSLVLWTRQERRTVWLAADDLEKAGQLAGQLATTCDVYVGCALQDQSAAFARWRSEHPGSLGEPTTRGYSDTARALPGLWVDIDVQGPAHKAAHLPPTKGAARTLLEEFPLSPTIIVDSGHGLQAWWLFREPWVFDTATERQTAQHLARRFLTTLQANAQAHSWQLDPIADLARVMRLPGTFNHKLAPVLVRVIEYTGTNRYNPSDIEPYLLNVAPIEKPPQHTWRGPTGVLTPVLHQCRFLQHCRAAAATLSEPEWYAMVSNLARLEEGREAVHALSQPYPRYSLEETEKKIAHALSAAGPHTCAYIQQQLGFHGCPPYGCGVKAPASLGLAPDERQTTTARWRAADLRARTILRRQAEEQHAREEVE